MIVLLSTREVGIDQYTYNAQHHSLSRAAVKKTFSNVSLNRSMMHSLYPDTSNDVEGDVDVDVNGGFRKE
jgi:hypothetical protein